MARRKYRAKIRPQQDQRGMGPAMPSQSRKQMGLTAASRTEHHHGSAQCRLTVQRITLNIIDARFKLGADVFIE